MPFIAAPNTAKLELLQTFNGQEVVNVLHAFENGEQTLAQMINIGTAFLATYTSELQAGKVPEWTLHEIRVTDLTASTGPQTTIEADVTGTNDVEPSGSELSVVVSLLTDLRGRSFRGRVYDAGYDETTFNKDGTLAGDQAVNIANVWQNVIDSMESNDFPLQVVSYFTFDEETQTTVPRPEAVSTDVKQARGNPIAGIQRRRIHH